MTAQHGQPYEYQGGRGRSRSSGLHKPGRRPRGKEERQGWSCQQTKALAMECLSGSTSATSSSIRNNCRSPPKECLAGTLYQRS